jgi:hypothetical protein
MGFSYQVDRHVPEGLKTERIRHTYRVSQKDVYTKLIFRIIMCIHLFGILCIRLAVCNMFCAVDEMYRLEPASLIGVCDICEINLSCLSLHLC